MINDIFSRLINYFQLLLLRNKVTNYYYVAFNNISEVSIGAYTIVQTRNAAGK